MKRSFFRLCIQLLTCDRKIASIIPWNISLCFKPLNYLSMSWNFKYTILAIYTCSWSASNDYHLTHFPQIHNQPRELHESQNYCYNLAHNKYLRNEMKGDWYKVHRLHDSEHCHQQFSKETFSKIMKRHKLQSK